MSTVRSLLESSGVVSLLPFVAVIVVVGVAAILALFVFGARRMLGRTGDADERAAQLAAQICASRGWEKPELAPPWDGEDRLGLPKDISEAGV